MVTDLLPAGNWWPRIVLMCVPVALAAVGARSINLKRVARGQVAVLAANFLLDLCRLRRKEFHRRAALGANHVVMAAAIVLMLVARDAVVKSNFAGQPATGQQL